MYMVFEYKIEKIPLHICDIFTTGYAWLGFNTSEHSKKGANISMCLNKLINMYLCNVLCIKK